jgi:phosphopantetheine binding protein
MEDRTRDGRERAAFSPILSARHGPVQCLRRLAPLATAGEARQPLAVGSWSLTVGISDSIVSGMPTVTEPNPTRGHLTPDAVEGMIGKLVAAAPGQAGTGFAAELPIDSLLAVEILCDLEDSLGVRLPDDKLTADSLRSARALATHVCKLAVQVEASSA